MASSSSTPGDGKDAVYGRPGATVRFCSVTHDILGDPFWAVYRRGLRDAAHRFDCQVHHRAPERFSPELMARLLERASADAPAGILATIPDAEVVDAPLRSAIADGIPVIAVNARDPRPATERIPYLAYIGADDAAGGQMVAKRLSETGPVRRGLTVDHYLVDNACHTARCDGFLEELARRSIPGERLRVPGDNPAASVDTIKSYLSEHPDVDAVCTLGPPGCLAAIAAIEQAGSDARHGSFDLAPEQLHAMIDGTLLFTIDSQQYLQAYLGIVLLNLYVAHGFVPGADVMTGPAVVDHANVTAALAGVQAGVR
jgi:simple sugar transport system substrate-binding protein